MRQENLPRARKLRLTRKLERVSEGHRRLQAISAQLFNVSTAAAGQIHDYPDLLQDLGVLLCARHPSRFCCNDPDCNNVATTSEGFMLVRGKACACGGCLGCSKRPALAPTFCTGAR
jgi:hypothetical protein